ncbi:MAG: CDP-diacylglycerol--glycerol-3-phosphate 3-phosphatidyltransferase [Corynebacterium sp.]|nr:CDP-diacylglycerol--glycerol-3-phosphate 3-phosphatidyltransferase [Corynebacterium sp.]
MDTPELKDESQPANTAPSNWNLPNILTSLRIVFTPVFAWLVVSGMQWWAFGLFVALMITDKLDGDIARARGLITNFGKIADPIADKALMAAAFISLNVIGVLPVWVTVIVLVREFGITLWRMWMLRRGKVVPASRGGKLKTALQTVAIALYLLPLPEWMGPVAFAVMIIAVAVTVITGVQYLVDSRKVR